MEVFYLKQSVIRGVLLSKNALVCTWLKRKADLKIKNRAGGVGLGPLNDFCSIMSLPAKTKVSYGTNVEIGIDPLGLLRNQSSGMHTRKRELDVITTTVQAIRRNNK